MRSSGGDPRRTFHNKSVPENLSKRTLGRMVPTHPVHADAWRGRRRADVQPTNRRGVSAPGRTRDQLSEIAYASANVSSNEIRVASFEIDGWAR